MQGQKCSCGQFDDVPFAGNLMKIGENPLSRGSESYDDEPRDKVVARQKSIKFHVNVSFP